MEINNSGLKLNLPENLAKVFRYHEILKSFAVYSVIISLVFCLLFFASINKPTDIVVLSEAGLILKEASSTPKPEAEVESALRNYVSYRYNYTPQNIKSQLMLAETFIDLGNSKAFRESMNSALKFVQDRNAESRYYIRSVKVNLSEQKAVLEGDRIAVIQGMMVASAARTEITFASVRRSIENPWGVSIMSEREFSMQ